MAQIFISYARNDAAADSNALYQSLAARYGAARLFKDVDNVPLGENWKVAIRTAVQQSSVLLVVMGPDWRLSGAIQIELETALAEGIPIVPLLVNGASMEDLRDVMAGAEILADLNAAELDHASWNRDLEPVIQAIDRITGSTSASPSGDSDPARNAPSWSARITSANASSHVELSVALTEATVVVRFEIGWVFNRVLVDGVQVSKRVGAMREELHRFEIVDGNAGRSALLTMTGTMLLASVGLEIDGMVLLDDEPMPSSEP